MGRMLNEYWTADRKWLEETHDYIQWMFPLPEPSQFNPHCPILNEENRQRCIWDDEVNDNLNRSFHVMHNFYGLPWVCRRKRMLTDEYDVMYDERVVTWFKPRNHNFLRLTRIRERSPV